MKLFHKAPKPKAKDRSLVEQHADILRGLCGNDGAMYEALSNFLLLNPRDQEQRIGSISDSMEQGNRELIGGNKLHARLNFETAARLGLYHQDRENVVKALKLADETDEETSEARHRMHGTLLTHIDRALEIARQYYDQFYAKSLGKEEPEESKTQAAPILV